MSIIGVRIHLFTDDGHKKRMMKMNGLRIARKYIERLKDEDLQAMWELAKDDIEYEAVIITYLLECEMEKRKK